MHLAFVEVSVHPGACVGRKEGDEQLLADDARVHLLQVGSLEWKRPFCRIPT